MFLLTLFYNAFSLENYLNIIVRWAAYGRTMGSGQAYDGQRTGVRPPSYNSIALYKIVKRRKDFRTSIHTNYVIDFALWGHYLCSVKQRLRSVSIAEQTLLTPS